MGGSFTSLVLCLSVIFEVCFSFLMMSCVFVMGKEPLMQITKS